MSSPLESLKGKNTSRRVAGVCAIALGLCALFSKPLVALVLYAAHNELNSHVLLVPFVSAYLLYIRRQLLPRDYDASPGWAMIPLIAGGIALAAAWTPGVFGGPLSPNDYLALMTLSFVCFLAAAGFLFLGKNWMAAAAF